MLKEKFTKSEIESLNDIYIILPDDEVIYIPYDFYSNPDRVIESVDKDAYGNAIFSKTFFLEDGVYPINLSGPTVSKVIPWNLAKNDSELKSFDCKEDLGSPQTGYFIDLRQYKMSRLNMIKVAEEKHDILSDTPLNNDSLFFNKNNKTIYTNKETVVLVPKDQMYQLKQVPDNNLYIAFFKEPEKTHNNIDCYSYSVSYITAEEVRQHTYKYDETTQLSRQDEAVIHLKSYYGDTCIQSGALNPLDIYPNETQSIDSLNGDKPDSVVIGGPRDGGGGTCYVANLATFKK